MMTPLEQLMAALLLAKRNDWTIDTAKLRSTLAQLAPSERDTLIESLVKGSRS
jgi:hypothetical protein